MPRWTIPVVLAAFAGCHSRTLAPPAPVVLQMHEAADSAAYAPYLVPGTAAIVGRAFIRLPDSLEHAAWGQPVTLDPMTPYMVDWFQQIGADPYRFDEVPPDSWFRRARRLDTADAHGRFRFDSLPAGTYILRSVVAWMHGAGYSMPGTVVVADTLTIAAGELRSFEVDLPLLPASGFESEILTEDQLRGRQYVRLGQVSGVSCQVSPVFSPPPSLRVARLWMVIEMQELQGDVVTNVVCRKGGVTLRENCVSYIKCTGEAIRWVRTPR